MQPNNEKEPISTVDGPESQLVRLRVVRICVDRHRNLASLLDEFELQKLNDISDVIFVAIFL